jgi:hypothetical protein
VPKKLIEKLISQNSSIISKLGDLLTGQKKIQDRMSALEKKSEIFNEQDFIKVRFK